jgi:hypothetical protein
MEVVMELVNKNPKQLPQIQKLASDKLDIKFIFHDNGSKYQVMKKASKGNKMIIGYLDESLRGFSE